MKSKLTVTKEEKESYLKHLKRKKLVQERTSNIFPYNLDSELQEMQDITGEMLDWIVLSKKALERILKVKLSWYEYDIDFSVIFNNYITYFYPSKKLKKRSNETRLEYDKRVTPSKYIAFAEFLQIGEHKKAINKAISCVLRIHEIQIKNEIKVVNK